MNASPRQQKADLRKEARQAVLALSDEDRAAKNEAIQKRVLDWAGFRTASSVLLYASHFPEEIPTRPLMDKTLKDGRYVVLPRVDQANQCMTLFRIMKPDEDLVPGALGIPEPREGCREVSLQAVDLVLVPGLAFDEEGYRVGRGAGYYDRLLGAEGFAAASFAIAYEAQIVSSIPREDHDQPVSRVITEERLLETKASPW